MSNYSDKIGQIKQTLDPTLLEILHDLASGNTDRAVVAKSVTASSLVGTLTGANIGTHTGNSAPGSIVCSSQELTASGEISANTSFVILNKAGGSIAATLALPTAGRFLVITQADAGTAGHTVTLGAGTWDGTNDVATFDAAGETLIVFGLSATRFLIILNNGSVTFS